MSTDKNIATMALDWIKGFIAYTSGEPFDINNDYQVKGFSGYPTVAEGGNFVVDGPVATVTQVQELRRLLVEWAPAKLYANEENKVSFLVSVADFGLVWLTFHDNYLYVSRNVKNENYKIPQVPDIIWVDQLKTLWESLSVAERTSINGEHAPVLCGDSKTEPKRPFFWRWWDEDQNADETWEAFVGYWIIRIEDPEGKRKPLYLYRTTNLEKAIKECREDLLSNAKNKIQAIKKMRTLVGYGLADAKLIIEHIMDSIKVKVVKPQEQDWHIRTWSHCCCVQSAKKGGLSVYLDRPTRMMPIARVTVITSNSSQQIKINPITGEISVQKKINY